MFEVILAIDQDIIDVDNHEFVKEGSENLLDQGLECGGGVSEAKGHDLVLVMAISGTECSFLDIIFVDSNLMIPRAQVNLGEHLGMVKLVHEVLNERDGEPILDGDLVQGAVVHTHT